MTTQPPPPMHVLDDRCYTAEHEWVRLGEPTRVGITDHAADALGDVVFVELPAVGSDVVAGEVCGEIESTKAVSDLFAPLSGRVVRINDAAVDAPELIGHDPFGDGWLFELESTGEHDGLLGADAYRKLLGG